MKKITTISLLFALSAAFALNVDDINNLSSDDVNLAQNARIVAEKSDDAEANLLKAFTSEKNQLAKDGIIYSLAAIKSETAFKSIVDLAKKGDKTAILALAKYGDKAVGILKGLSDKNELAAIALALASSEVPANIIPDLNDFNNADENAKVDMLRNIALGKDTIGLLAKVDCSSERIALAVITAYAKIGGNDAAKKIMQIQAEKNLDSSQSSLAVAILASCDNADDALNEGVVASNVYAIRAVKERRLAFAENSLIGLAKGTDANLRKEALEAIATCGGVKSMSLFLDNIDKAGSDLALYVKVANAVYKTLNEADSAKFKASFEEKAASAEPKVKAAIERIIAEPKVEAKKK